MSRAPLTPFAAIGLFGALILSVVAVSVRTSPPVIPATAFQKDKEFIPKNGLGQGDKKFDSSSKGRGYKPLTEEKRAYYQRLDRAKHGDHIERAAKNLVLPAAFDGRVRVPLPMWDQGPCGSCYLVSTVRTMTCAGVLTGLGKADGSFMQAAQYGMDRPRNFGGCDGGNGTEVIDWAVKNGWIAETYVDSAGAAHRDYPAYQAKSGNDRTAPGAKVWVKGWTWGLVSNSGRPTADQIKAALFLYGRLNVSLDAGGQFGNGTGTITALGNGIDHEINMVAWDDSKDGGAFLLENQWGAEWGVGGYRWVTYKAAQNIVDMFWVSAGPVPPDTVPVPNVVGDTLGDATAVLKGAGLAVGATTGDTATKVVGQSPAAATQTAPGTPVALTFGTTPQPVGVPPFMLYEGQAPNYVLVGNPNGYPTLLGAESDAKAIATKDEVSVTIWDSSKPSALVETVKPQPPLPPIPLVGSLVIPDLTASQQQSILDQLGAMIITGDMTLDQIIAQYQKNRGKAKQLRGDK